LLFALPLNILVNTHKKISISHHTPITRSLCECELYAPAKYDNDPQMKEAMDNFNKQTQQRFHEYDERMKTTREKCKDKCHKEIQKIILKDKMEKELAETFSTLETKIDTDDIPTCICEKSIADRTEKFCLNCGKTMGGVAYGWGLVGGLMYTGWINYVATTVAKATMDAGMNVIRGVLKKLGVEEIPAEIFKKISSINDFSKVKNFADIIYTELETSCASPSLSAGAKQAMDTYNICTNVKNGPEGVSAVKRVVSGALDLIVDKAPKTAKAQALEVSANYTSTTSSLINGITASILAIEIIVLIMMIIYWILRYRRKKKMKKKLQYIKLLEE
ncbi:rifin, partial [Plasmodium reichenowi]